MKRLILLIMLNYPGMGMSQEYVLFRNGSTLEVLKWKFDRQVLKVTQKDNSKREFTAIEVDGIIDSKKEKVKYFRNLSADSKEPTSVEKIVTGGINLYQFTYRTGGQYGSTISEIFLEKGDLFELVPTSDLFDGKAGRVEKVEWLKRLLSSQAAIVNELNDPSFKPKDKNIIDIVTRYNLLEYSPVKEDDNLLASCVFYLKKGNDVGQLTVNDNFSQKINSKYPSVAKASQTNTSKACVKIGESNLCTIFKVTPHFINYFELSIDEDKVNIELKSSIIAQRHMLYNRGIKP